MSEEHHFDLEKYQCFKWHIGKRYFCCYATLNATHFLLSFDQSTLDQLFSVKNNQYLTSWLFLISLLKRLSTPCRNLENAWGRTMKMLSKQIMHNFRYVCPQKKCKMYWQRYILINYLIFNPIDIESHQKSHFNTFEL